MTVDEAAEWAAREYTAGNKQHAEALCRQVFEVQPNHPLALHVLGAIAADVGQFAIAEQLLAQSISLRPHNAGAHRDRARALEGLARPREAAEAYRAAVNLEPDNAPGRNALGLCLHAIGEYAQAIEQYQKAMQLRPAEAVLPNNIGNALQGLDRPEDSLEWYRKAVELKSDYAEAYSNWASAMRELKRMDEAIELYSKAVEIRPDYASAHRNRALTLLTMGRLREGWDEWEWRWKASGFNTPLRDWKKPAWNGEPLDGRTILLHQEQGLGDAIQFARYIPMVKQRGAREIVVETLPRLASVMATAPHVSRVVKMGEKWDAEFDVHCSLLTLARIFGTTMETIPANVPYLHAPDDRKAAMEQRLGPPHGRLRVGLVWSGNPAQPENRRRRATLKELSKLGRVKGVRFYSLQMGDEAKELSDAPAEFDITDLAKHDRDLGDTAAALDQLDLLIATDTSVPHLAGAMGRPVWVMLAYMADWRWLLDRTDTPWYPTMRLFRQEKRGDWTPVIEQIAKELEKRAAVG